MAKNKNKVGSIQVGITSDMHGRMVEDWQINNLIGKMLTFIESLGFSESREKATKDIVRQMIENALFTESAFVGIEEMKVIWEKERKNKAALYADNI